MKTGSPEFIAEDVLSIAMQDAVSAQSLAATLRSSQDWVEVVAGLDSVCVHFDPLRLTAEAAVAKFQEALGRSTQGTGQAETNVIEVPVRYGGKDGPDLHRVAEVLSLSEAEFVRRQSARLYTAEMIGFTPGFAYLAGLDKGLAVARLDKPRAHVAPGSIGVSGGYCGLYAMAGPGGWPIIGRTDLVLFDASQPDLFRIRAGDQVRFVPA